MTAPIDHDALRAQASAAEKLDRYDAFIATASPATVLALLDEIEALSRTLSALADELRLRDAAAIVRQTETASGAPRGDGGVSDMETYAFTFGVGHRNHDRFVKIEAASELEARLLMIGEYGRAWSSVYLWADFVPQIERYGYVELPFGEVVA